MRTFAILLSLCLGACSLIPNPGEPPKRIILSAWKPSEPFKSSHKQIMIDMPTVYPPLDNQRLALRPKPQMIDYYADVEWGDRLGTLVQDALIMSFQDSKLFAGVTRSIDGIIPDYTVKIDIRQFDVQKSTPDIAKGEYYVQLINVSSRQVVAQETFEIDQKLPDESLGAVIQALNNIHVRLSEQLLSWLQKTLAAH